MAAIGNMTVKKADGTTDVTFTAVSGSSGDQNPAIWRDEASSTLVAARTSLELSAQYNRNRSFRHMNATFLMFQTYTDTTSGLVRVSPNPVKVAMHVQMPSDLPATLWAEAAAQACNLFDHASIQAAFAAGLAPT